MTRGRQTPVPNKGQIMGQVQLYDAAYVNRWEQWRELRDQHVPAGRTVGGWSYGDFLAPYVQYIDKDSDIHGQAPGPKVINTLVGYVPQRQQQDDWYAPWEQASDPITPYLQWNAPEDLRYNWMLVNRNHRRSLLRQIEENESYRYWDEGFALLQAQTLTDNTMALNHSLHVQTLNYMVTATYFLFLWTYPFLNQSRSPFTIYPGLKTTSYVLVFHSRQEVVNIMDNGQNVIWSNVPGRLQAWLRLLSAPGVEKPGWKQQDESSHRYLCSPGGRVRYQNINYRTREREFGWFINGAPAVVRGSIGFSTTIWNYLL